MWGIPGRSNALNIAQQLRCSKHCIVCLPISRRLLWGIPGRSNALNIAQRLGLDRAVVDAARAKLGAAAAQVNTETKFKWFLKFYPPLRIAKRIPMASHVLVWLGLIISLTLGCCTTTAAGGASPPALV